MARKDAVRFDLKVDPRRPNDAARFAGTMSGAAGSSSSVQPEDFLTRSLFTITPEMTDDRRPLPMQETPSPALRRYLNPSLMNPTLMSPAEMYVYHDHPHDKPQASDLCPVSIQMQTYRRAGGRGNRRSHFHIASKDHKYGDIIA
jgi:hypothetical protein